MVAQEGHIPAIAAGMREADRLEVWLSHHMAPERAAWDSFRHSTRVWTVLDFQDASPIAMFGVVEGPLLSSWGTIWMLGTQGIEQWSVAFAKHSRHYVNEMLQVRNPLANYVHAENNLAIAWLEWLGAEFEEPKPYGPEGAPFRRFILRGK